MNLIFHLSIALFFAHELDAVRHSEWKLLYVLRDLDDSLAYSIFVLAHILIIALVLWLNSHDSHRIQAFFKVTASTFLIVHALLHLSFINTVEHTFEGALSNILIYASASVAALYLILLGLRQRAYNAKY